MANDGQLRWNSDEVFQLIDIVKACGCIYNPLDRNYFCRPYVENLWRDIDIRLGKRPGVSLSKWTNLRISFRREYQLLIKKKSKPSWIYFDKMVFLLPFLRKKREQNEQLESHIQEALEQISSMTRGNFKSFVANIEPCDEIDPTDCSEEILEDDSAWNQSIKEENDECQDEQIECIENSDDEILQDDASEHSDMGESISMLETAPENLHKSPDSIRKRTQVDPSTSLECKRRIIIESDPSQPMDLAKKDVSCECKTNPDAMFLMSLMPDIQLLSRKDKGIFKLEVQRVIQNLLYPDE